MGKLRKKAQKIDKKIIIYIELSLQKKFEAEVLNSRFGEGDCLGGINYRSFFD